MTFDEFYERARRTSPSDLSWNPYGFPHLKQGSDMSAHMPLFTFLARQCQHITEFGCREGTSTVAFLKGLPPEGKLISIDLQKYVQHDDLKKMILPAQWELRYEDILQCEIEETDLLLVDDLHTGEQVRQELQRHGGQVRKWLVFHDTYSQGVISQDRAGEPGILGAIEEYCQGWQLVYECWFNHGLRVYERIA